MSRNDARRGPSILLALLAPLCGCLADSRIAPSYPGTIVLVAEDATGSLLEIEPNGGHVQHAYPVAGPVVAIATARNGQFAATIDAGGDVVVCDLARHGRDAAWRVDGPGRATGLVFADRRTTLAASFAGSGEVLLLGRESGRIEGRIATGCSSIAALALAPRGASVYAACDGPPTLVRIDLEARAAVERIPLHAAPTALAAGPDLASTWVATGAAGAATAWSSRLGAVGLGSAPVALATPFDGSPLVASAAQAGAALCISAEAGPLDPRPVAIRAPAGAAARAWPVALDLDGRLALVSIPDAGRVVVVDVPGRVVRGAFETGGAPGAIAWTLMRAPPELGLGAEPR